MDGKDLDLIALSYALSRYKAQGALITDKNDIGVGELKTALFAGTSYSSDADININVGSVETESNVTIIEQTVECDEHEHSEPIEPLVAEHTEPQIAESVDDQEQPPADPAPDIQKENPSPSPSLGGRLFQFFKGGNNESN